MSISQWSLSQLMQSARRDIAEQQVLELSRSSFDRFAKLLDEPPATEFTAFTESGTRWNR